MNTICSCFTCIVAIMFGLILNGMCLLCNFIEKDWGWFVWDIIVIILGVIAIRWLYKRANSIEESMQRNIQTVMNLQLFDLMRMAFGKYPDAFRNDFGANPKDKEDEVATDK